MRSIINKLITLLFVFAFLQIPFFMMQYMNHLEGHYKELEIYHAELLNVAKKSNLSLESYVLHFEHSPDPIINGQGHVMATTLDRFEEFGKARAVYREATPWGKPFVFIRYLDRGVVGETLSSFQVGFSLSLESLIYMAIGFVVGLLISNHFTGKSKHGHV